MVQILGLNYHAVMNIQVDTNEASVQKHLSSTIRMLGGLLGKTIIDQEGNDVYEIEEDVRHLAKGARAGNADSQKSLIEKMALIANDLPTSVATLKAFTTYFQLVNLAEEHERVRVLRARSEAAYQAGKPMDETIDEAIETLRADGVSAEQLQATLHDDVSLVLLGLPIIECNLWEIVIGNEESHGGACSLRGLMLDCLRYDELENT